MAQPNAYGGLSAFKTFAGVVALFMFVIGVALAVLEVREGGDYAVAGGIVGGAVAISLLYWALGDFARLMMDIEGHLANISDVADSQAVAD